jgi:hypothetical protein
MLQKPLAMFDSHVFLQISHARVGDERALTVVAVKCRMLRRVSVRMISLCRTESLVMGQIIVTLVPGRLAQFTAYLPTHRRPMHDHMVLFVLNAQHLFLALSALLRV